MVQGTFRRGLVHVGLAVTMLLSSVSFAGGDGKPQPPAGNPADASRPVDADASRPTDRPEATEPETPASPPGDLPAAVGGMFSRRRLLGCGLALALGGVAVGAWLFAPTVFTNQPIQLDPDGKHTPPANPRQAARELRDLLTERGGSLRVNVTDAHGDVPVLRLFDKSRLQRIAADKIKAAIQKRNPNVDGSEIGVGEAGMVIRVRYFELMLQPDGMVRLAVGGTTWRLESSRSYAPEELLDGSAHQMDFGPHIESDPQATASFRAGFLLRFDARSRSFAVPHAKCTMHVDARPFLNDEDSGEVRDVTTAELR